MASKLTLGSDGSTHSFLGSVNAGTTFFLDGTVNLFILAGILIGVFQFPTDIVFGRIIPGAAIAIFVGNVLIAWDTRQRAQRPGQENITAIPIGLDISTTFLMAYLVLGPIYSSNLAELGTDGAAKLAWYVGMAVTLWIGVGKLVLSLLGPSVQRILPDSAVLGTLAGVAIVWMGAEPLLGIFEHPEVGLFALGIIIVALMAGHRLPLNLPGAFIAVLLGTLAYLVVAALGLAADYAWPAYKPAALTFPHFSLGGLSETFNGGVKYFGIVLPLTLFSAISAVNVVRSANIIGDNFDTRRIMVIDGIATMASALSGGVVQTVCYLGHTTYKRMGAKSNYAVWTSAVILLLTLLGLIEFTATYIPNAVIKGVLIVVAADIIRISLQAVKSEQAPSFIFAIIPAVLAYAYSKLEQLYLQSQTAVTDLGGSFTDLLSADLMATYTVLGVLSRGSILTALLVSSMVCWIITKQFRKAAGTAALCALFSACGLIHSVMPTSEIYPPWNLPDLGGTEVLAWRFALAYLIMASVLFLFSFTRQDDTMMHDIQVIDTKDG